MPSIDHIAENLHRIRQQIADAAASVGRGVDEITLVGVTKYVDEAAAQLVAQSGCYDLGESRPQQLWPRAAALDAWPIRWHLIGHLQRNKVKRTIRVLHLLHSGDSMRLLTTVDEAASEIGVRQRVLLEVNISGDEIKHGFGPDEVEPLLSQLAEKKNLQIVGLMAMAAREGGLDHARRDFAALRELRDRLQAVCPPAIDLRELSMGMSDDFTAAIAEGATIVRIGSALFTGVHG